MLGNVNRVGPEGSAMYDQTGSYSWTDPYTNQTYDIPTFTENVTLSPGQQRTYDQQQEAEFNLARLASQQSDFLTDYMAEPIDLSNEAVEGRLFELGSKRLDPRFERERESLQTSLVNRGIREGTGAWDAAMGSFNEGRNDAYNRLLLEGRGQAVQEALAGRSQPINEIAALLGGSQVNIPMFTGGNMPTIPTTDNAGLINQNYNQRLANWQQQNAMGQNVLGGLFGLGSAAIMASDKRVKDDVQKVGKTDDDQPIYKFRYKGSPMIQLGLMAQDVERKKPEAVKEVGGVKFVDYNRALGAM